MKLLLDTHVLLWMLTGGRLGSDARQALVEPDNELFFSICSYWEICIKLSLGKLQLFPGWAKLIEDEMKVNSILWLPVDQEHCRHLLDLPHIHSDPFDRMLIAQAQIEHMTVVTADTFIRSYPVATIW